MADGRWDGPIDLDQFTASCTIIIYYDSNLTIDSGRPIIVTPSTFCTQARDRCDLSYTNLPGMPRKNAQPS